VKLSCRRSPAFLLVLAFALSACGAGREDEAETPAYAAPAYTVSDARVPETALRFTDITVDAGIDFVHETGAFGRKWMPETMGSGGGFLDYDGDGWPDIFLVNGMEWPGFESGRPPATLELYRNLKNGRFEDVTAETGLAKSLYGMGAAFADYDGDGDTDIFVSALGPNKLFRNDSGVFSDVTGEAGLSETSEASAQLGSWSTAAAWLDYDRDGRVDLFVCNYVQWTPETDLFTTLDGTTKSYATPEQYDGESCRLYRNADGERFSDVTSQAGLFKPDGKSLGVAIADINDDAWPDIVVANDTEHNFLYLNQRDGTFMDTAVGSGIGYDEYGRARAGMGIDAVQLEGVGRYSIAIGNFSQEPISLYTEIEDGLFQDFSGQARLSGASLLKLTFGLSFVDLNLDGFLDLAVANGHIEPTINEVQQNITFEQEPQLFLNSGAGTFFDAGGLVGDGFSRPVVARGVAHGDIDLDGDSDLLITVNGDRPLLLRNDLPLDTANSLVVEIRGRRPNTDALGAEVAVFASGRTQSRLVRTGSSYLTQSFAGNLIFGLGESAQADSVLVRWPTNDSFVKVGSDVAVGRYLLEERTNRLRRLLL